MTWVQRLTQNQPKPLAPSPEAIWAEQVQQFGAALQTLRQQRGWSIAQLYLNSYVPQYHLLSLEAGLVDKLPAPIFVRGFMKRIADSFGAEGAELLNLVPDRLPEAAVVTHWIDRIESPNLQPSHLYVGYAALLAGAVGGIALTHPSQASGPAWESQAEEPAPAGEQRLGDRANQQRTTEQAMRLRNSQPLGQSQMVDSFRPES
jgi:cytoskeleton protein RodZ